MNGGRKEIQQKIFRTLKFFENFAVMISRNESIILFLLQLFATSHFLTLLPTPIFAHPRLDDPKEVTQ